MNRPSEDQIELSHRRSSSMLLQAFCMMLFVFDFSPCFAQYKAPQWAHDECKEYTNPSTRAWCVQTHRSWGPKLGYTLDPISFTADPAANPYHYSSQFLSKILARQSFCDEGVDSFADSVHDTVATDIPKTFLKSICERRSELHPRSQEVITLPIEKPRRTNGAA